MNRCLLILGCLLLSACSTAISLTTEGARVTQYAMADIPAGCRVLSDVNIGTPPNAARPRSEEDLIILMRNKTATHGGNGLAVDSSDRREEAGREHYVGRGRAYACPEEESRGTLIHERNETGLPPPAEEEEEAPPGA